MTDNKEEKPQIAAAATTQYRYERGKLLGRGQVADVYAATQFSGPEDKVGRPVALKVVDLGDILTASVANSSVRDDDVDDENKKKEDADEDQPEVDVMGILNEMNILTRVECPYLAKYLDARVVYASRTESGDVKSDELQIAMEYYNAGSAFDVIQSMYPPPGDKPFFNENELRFLVKNILLGLNFLHERGIPHSGVKASNILLAFTGDDDIQVRLTDYGVFEQLQYQVSKRDTFLQSPFWMAPEIITQKNASGSTDSGMFSVQSDIWMLGITTIELITGSPPLFFEHAMKALFDIPKLDPSVYIDGIEKDAPRNLEPLNKIKEKLDAHFSDEVKSFLRVCLVQNPSDRWTAAKLLNEHPFITHPVTPEQEAEVRKTLVEKLKVASRPTKQASPKKPSPVPVAAAAAAAASTSSSSHAAQPSSSDEESKVLNTIIYPILTKLLSSQQPKSEEFITAIARLKMAFDNLEKNKNGSVLLFSRLVIAQLSQMSKK